MADKARNSAPSARGADEGAQPFSGCLVRLIWMGAGNFTLLMIAVSILHEPRWTFTWMDGLFWLTVGTLVVLRYWDVTSLGGLTVHGDPATSRHLRHYAAGLAGLSALLRTLAHALHLRT